MDEKCGPSGVGSDDVDFDGGNGAPFIDEENATAAARVDSFEADNSPSTNSPDVTFGVLRTKNCEENKLETDRKRTEIVKSIETFNVVEPPPSIASFNSFHEKKCDTKERADTDKTGKKTLKGVEICDVTEPPSGDARGFGSITAAAATVESLEGRRPDPLFEVRGSGEFNVSPQPPSAPESPQPYSRGSTDLESAPVNSGEIHTVIGTSTGTHSVNADSGLDNHQVTILEATAISSAEPIIYADIRTEEDEAETFANDAGDASHLPLCRRNSLVVICLVFVCAAAVATAIATAKNKHKVSNGNKESLLAEEETTVVPTGEPFTTPTDFPSATPTNSPTVLPTVAPTSHPTALPTATPTNSPTTASTRKVLASVLGLLYAPGNAPWQLVDSGGENGTSDDTTISPADPRVLAFDFLSSDDEEHIASNPLYLRSSHRIRQRYALATLFYATRGWVAWERPLNFLTSDHECTWNERWEEEFCFPNGMCQKTVESKGAFCDEDPDVVDRLNFIEHRLDGGLPTELGLLTGLTYLRMDGNRGLGGSSIPEDIGSYFPQLSYLHLGRNSLSGSIPPSIGMLSELKWLLLFDNMLSGSIPTGIASMTNLLDISLQRNLLNGTVPMVDWSQFDSLETLSIHSNNMVGNVDFCSLPWDWPVDSKGVWADCYGIGTSLLNCSCCTRCCEGQGDCYSCGWDPVITPAQPRCPGV
mmetsp:Transcript_22386/g.41720  ORF Transcript_22386/g.41720 Transcript_22386/m.41720 type:complete len:704 (-) Transcript_22386:631-2742(-)